MSRGSEASNLERARDPDPIDADVDAADEEIESEAPPDLSAMPIAGLTRGRLLALAGLFAAGWIVIAFARQVAAAGDLTDRADALRIGNVSLETRVAQLQAEMALVQRPEYVALQARAHRLGSAHEVPFTLAAGASALSPDAPGSRSVALGAQADARPPLEAWLTILFAPSD